MEKKPWNYAWLSKLAKQHGGPEQLIDDLVKSGKLQMIPWIIAALFTGGGIVKLSEYLKTKYDESIYAGERAKLEIIQGIKEYEAASPQTDAEEIEAEFTSKEEQNTNE